MEDSTSLDSDQSEKMKGDTVVWRLRVTELLQAHLSHKQHIHTYIQEDVANSNKIFICCFPFCRDLHTNVAIVLCFS